MTITMMMLSSCVKNHHRHHHLQGSAVAITMSMLQAGAVLRRPRSLLSSSYSFLSPPHHHYRPSCHPVASPRGIIHRIQKNVSTGSSSTTTRSMHSSPPVHRFEPLPPEPPTMLTKWKKRMFYLDQAVTLVFAHIGVYYICTEGLIPKRKNKKHNGDDHPDAGRDNNNHHHAPDGSTTESQQQQQASTGKRLFRSVYIYFGPK